MAKSIEKALADAAAGTAARTAAANPDHARMQEIARELAERATNTR